MIQHCRWIRFVGVCACITLMLLATAAPAAIISIDRTGGASGSLDGHAGGGSYNGDTDPPIHDAGFANGAWAHADRGTQFWQTVPGFLAGADYAETFNNDKSSGDTTENHAVTFSQNGVLYLLLDNQHGNEFDSFLTDGSSGTRFYNTGLKLTKDEGAKIENVSIYEAPVWAGQTVDLGNQSGGGMYGIAASQTIAPFGDYLKVDIGPSGQRVEPGYQAFTGPAANTNGTAVGPLAVTAIDGATINMTVSGVDWRDRGSAPGVSLGRVGEDLVKHNTSTITVTLDGLPAGAYQFTSYHRDPGTDQTPAAVVRVTDAAFPSGSGNLAKPGQGNADSAVSVGALSTQTVDNTAAFFQVVSNGSPIAIEFQGTGNDTEVPLNGLRIQREGLLAGKIAKVTRRDGNDPVDPIVETNLQEDSLAFGDRTHEYNDIPDFLLGAEYVRFANDDRSAGDIVHTVWLNGTTETRYAFLFFDNREALPQWAFDAGFADTGEDIGIDESGDGSINQTSSVMMRELSTDGGPMGLVLLQNNINGGNNYGFAVSQVPEPTSGLLAMLGIAATLACAGARRRS